ncbi:uncharacterized protein [Pseudorca crassidens]|uniref:uncharacterized protein isoform X2 n=1 Tax=Pseudorca crassidens TaxID=82174 RepID=UPI00352DD133
MFYESVSPCALGACFVPDLQGHRCVRHSCPPGAGGLGADGCRNRRLQVSASGATESTHPGQGGRSGRDPAGVSGEAFQRKWSCRLTCKVVTAARPCAAAFVKICSSHPLSRGTVQFMATPLLANYSYFCQPVDDSQSLFILRKKPEQLTFLHVYHHGTVLLNGYTRSTNS